MVLPRSSCDLPLVSVIVPTYNRAAWLPRAVASLEQQGWRDFKALVCDDGSTDDTPQVVQRLAAGSSFPLRYLRFRHGGPAWARNRGVAESRGRYVALLDSDDTFAPDKLGLQVEMMNSDPDAAFCYTGYRLMPSGRRIGSGEFARDRFLRANYLCCASVLMRRSLLLRIGGYDRTLRAAEDWDLLIRLSRHGQVHGSDEAMYHYTLHPGQTTRQTSMVDRFTRLVHRRHGGAIDKPVRYLL